MPTTAADRRSKKGGEAGGGGRGRGGGRVQRQGGLGHLVGAVQQQEVRNAEVKHVEWDHCPRPRLVGKPFHDGLRNRQHARRDQDRLPAAALSPWPATGRGHRGRRENGNSATRGSESEDGGFACACSPRGEGSCLPRGSSLVLKGQRAARKGPGPHPLAGGVGRSALLQEREQPLPQLGKVKE